MPDILTLSLTHGRRSFSVLHDPRPDFREHWTSGVLKADVELKDGEYRGGMVGEIAALAELLPGATLGEMMERWRNMVPVSEFLLTGWRNASDRPKLPKPTCWPTLSVVDCADACRIIFDLLTRDPQDDLDAVVGALTQAGFGEVAQEMRGSVNTTDIG